MYTSNAPSYSDPLKLISDEIKGFLLKTFSFCELHGYQAPCSQGSCLRRRVGSYGFQSGWVCVPPGLLELRNQWLCCVSGRWGWSQSVRAASPTGACVFSVPGLSLEMCSAVVTELKDSGTLSGAPVISKNGSRWSRKISFANYLNGWADKTLHSPMRAKGSWISGHFWPTWPSAMGPGPAVPRLLPSTLRLLQMGPCIFYFRTCSGWEELLQLLWSQ